ncbi:interleukin-11 [Chanos chanos]|uniref:Interleukin-11 n=1 Tax=Chanos chanos TaxID=29144 RepID=A0A6J2WC25_CHACN|nr:interleukin-11 [Chanos chanos]
MKVLIDSSSSLLFSLLLAQLPLFTSAFPAHHRRFHADFEKLTNQTKHLLKLTQDLLKEPVFDTEISHHRFKSLPAISSRASDLSTLELKPTLSQLHADLKSFEHHFEWLNKATRKQHHVFVPKLGELITHIKGLINALQRQMVKAEAPRLPAPSPSLPSHPSFHWEMVQTSHELLQQFRIFCDWASRALLTLKSKYPA